MKGREEAKAVVLCDAALFRVLQRFKKMMDDGEIDRLTPKGRALVKEVKFAGVTLHWAIDIFADKAGLKTEGADT